MKLRASMRSCPLPLPSTAFASRGDVASSHTSLCALADAPDDPTHSFTLFCGLTGLMMKQRHIPVRTCVACRSTDEKRDLLRIVRLPDGTASYDSRGKASGRGAYLCPRQSCLALARKQKRLERALKVEQIPESLFVELSALATEPEQPANAETHEG